MKYLRYFFYLWNNWNFSIASHLYKEEKTGEEKYGIDTTGMNDLKHLKQKDLDTSHSTFYMPASYGLLADIFDRITPSSYKHFLDIGCGKGRVICVAAHFGFTKITGVDFSREFVAQAKENAAITMKKVSKSKINVELNDAAIYEIPTDVDCVFLFNPFDVVLLEKVLKNIDESLSKNPRDITLIYLNIPNKGILKAFGYTEIHHQQKLVYLQASIYIKKARTMPG